MSRNTIEEKNLTPRQVVEALDKYIVGQSEAKRSVAISLRNRWRRLNSEADIRDEIVPNNILMIGPTGVGKTEIARRLRSEERRVGEGSRRGVARVPLTGD